MRKLLTVILFTIAALTATAQESPYKFDFGANIGMSSYLGDANSTPLFKHPGFVGEGAVRYIADARWAFRGILGYLSLSGDTADMDTALPGGARYEFSSSVIDLGVRAEFNFLPYGIGETYKRLHRWTPYLTVGLGACLAMSDGATSFAPTIPLGVGVKFKLSQRWNLGVEFTMTKAFGDHIDSKDLADLNQIQTSFIKNTDWYSRVTLGISYEFGERCATCHYVD